MCLVQRSSVSKAWSLASDLKEKENIKSKMC